MRLSWILLIEKRVTISVFLWPRVGVALMRKMPSLIIFNEYHPFATGVSGWVWTTVLKLPTNNDNLLGRRKYEVSVAFSNSQPLPQKLKVLLGYFVRLLSNFVKRFYFVSLSDFCVCLFRFQQKLQTRPENNLYKSYDNNLNFEHILSYRTSISIPIVSLPSQTCPLSSILFILTSLRE